MTTLEDRWGVLVGAWAPDGEAAEAGRALLARYGEPHRRYHTRAHLEAVVAALFLDLAADPVGVELAAFFHDAVYDPRAPAGVNERRSATLAEATLGQMGVPAPTVATVARLVLTTADHLSDGDRDAAVLNDADLAVLGRPPTVYSAYAAAVRAEYGWLADAEWRAGRRRVLAALLARPALYATRRGRAHWDATARANIRSELDRLSRDERGGT